MRLVRSIRVMRAGSKRRSPAIPSLPGNTLRSGKSTPRPLISTKALARGRRAKAFVEINGLGVLFPDRSVLPGKLGIAGERLFDPARITRIERTGRMPGQQHLYFTGLLFQHFFARCHHGQPRSMPAALSSSANFLRA